jgi:hypothetical protein
MPSLDSITFDTSDLSPGEGPPHLRVWYSKLGDGMGLYYFAKPPDIQRGLKSLDELRGFDQFLTQNSPAKLVQVATTNIGGCPAVRTIIKSPQKPTGMTYVGSVTIPFRDFSYVFKAQCEERGTTGVREAILFEKGRRAGTVTIGPGGKISGDWNPGDERYDADFPRHPLSRLRVLLGKFQTTCAIDPAVASQPPFPLP